MRKIATCCYCGTRAALVLRGEGRHELSCEACGAPLHEMKAMPCAAQMRANPGPGQRSGPKPAPRSKPAPHPYDVPRGASELGSQRERQRYRQPARRHKRRKPLLRKALEEIWDVVEDILD